MVDTNLYGLLVSIKNTQSHIDIRKFQRGSDNEGEDVFFPTKYGFRFLESEFHRVVKEYQILSETYVHPTTIKKSFYLLRNGEFESATSQAFKCIETIIRGKINADAEDVGVKLIRKAFNPDNGELADYDFPKAEKEAFANYIAGAFRYYKNPCSHRNVKLNFVSTFERVVVVCDLFKVIDKAQKSSL